MLFFFFFLWKRGRPNADVVNYKAGLVRVKPASLCVHALMCLCEFAVCSVWSLL